MEKIITISCNRALAVARLDLAGLDLVWQVNYLVMVNLTLDADIGLKTAAT